MARGGVRPGSGRPKGAVSRMNEVARAKALATGISPLDFLLVAMRDEKQELGVRLDAAKAAAPYVHARLNAVTVGGNGEDGEITLRTIVTGVPRPGDIEGAG